MQSRRDRRARRYQKKYPAIEFERLVVLLEENAGDVQKGVFQVACMICTMHLKGITSALAARLDVLFDRFLKQGNDFGMLAMMHLKAKTHQVELLVGRLSSLFKSAFAQGRRSSVFSLLINVKVGGCRVVSNALKADAVQLRSESLDHAFASLIREHTLSAAPVC